MDTAFIGIDLAWRNDKNPSGGAVLIGDRRCARLIDVNTSLRTFSAVHAYIEHHANVSTIVAIDAPLVITNRKGQRECETLVGKHYAARQASCHSSNLTLYPQAAGVHLASTLVSQGFRHAPDVPHPESERVILEVYPHPALIELFQLPSIIKYKKMGVARKRGGQRELQQRLRELAGLTPPLESTPKLSDYLALDTNSLQGVNLKANEDGLDAIICAYIAYYYWYWGLRGMHLFGNVDSGYVIVPVGPQIPS